MAGGANYQGDLASGKVFTFEQTQFGAGLYGRYHLNKHFSLRGNVFYTKLIGDDLNFVDEAAWRATRALNFSSPVIEVSFTPEWHILGNTIKRTKVRPYLFGGIGAVFTNPTNNLSVLVPSAPENAPGYYPASHFSFPVGGGINIDLSRQLTLGLEASSHFPLTDYLDGISESANPDKNDWFVFGGLTLGYKLGGRVPKIVDTDKDGIQDDKDKCPLVYGTLRGCPDADADGIADISDDCPNLPGLKDFNGCPDTDADGVADINDECPDIRGLVGLNGCPDTDADGIADAKDNCPDVAGSLASNGCPDDSDGDGVADADDKCPTLKGAINGCPDTDNDGIADLYDNCPQVAGLNSTNGCPDADGDGIADAFDNCPTTPGVSSNKGCPEVLVSRGTTTTSTYPTTSTSTIIETPTPVNTYTYLVEDVYFWHTRAKIDENEYDKLDQVVSLMNENPYYNLKIKGHTDDTGDYALNDHLSMRRARRCYKYLASKGIDLYRMSFEGLGASEPKHDNNTEHGKKMNRRVEFAFVQ